MLYNSYQLDIWCHIKKHADAKTGKQKLKTVLKEIFRFTLQARSSRHDDVCRSIMHTAEHYEVTFDMGFDEALENAVLKRKFCIRDKLEDSAEEAESPVDDYESDSSMESNNNDSSDEESVDSGFDI